MNEEKATLENLLASIPLGIIACDALGNITVFNKWAEAISGHSAEDMLGSPVRLFYQDPQEGRKIARLLHESVGGRISGYETSLRSKNGELIPVRLSASLLYDSSGKPAGSLAYFEDLSSVREGERRTELLLGVNNIVANAETLEEGLQILAELIVPLLSYAFCLIYIIDESGTSLQVNAAYFAPRSGGTPNWSPGLGRLIDIHEWDGLSEVLQSGKSRAINSDNEEARDLLAKFSEALGLVERVKLLLTVPLKMADGAAIGLLVVGEMRDAERSPLTQKKIELADAIAAQISILVRRLWHYERRRTLLVRLGNAAHSIMAKYDREKIYQETVTLAVGLVGYAAGVLFRKQPQQGFELCAEYRLGREVGLKIPPGSGLLASVAQTGEPRVVQRYSDSAEGLDVLADCGFQTVIAVPLKHASQVEAVLLVGERTGRRISSEAELEVLERFAEQASIALQTSALVSREKLAFRHLEVLHQISDYIMSARDVGKVFDAVLTGITAGYGLGFNRATIFLLDELQEALVGQKGIGHLDRDAAVRDWEADLAHGVYDFKSSINSLEEEDARLDTPVNAAVAGMRLPVDEVADDLFTRAVRGNEWLLVTSEFDRLPAAFRAALNPTSPLLVVPLSARGQAIGLFTVDNEFTHAPIKEDDVEAVMTFANTAAMAAENIRLFNRIQEGSQKLRMLFTASTALSTSREPRQVLDEIVEGTRVAARADSVEIVLKDEMGRSQVLVKKGAGGERETSPPADWDEHGARLMRPDVYYLLEGRGDPARKGAGSPDVIRCQQLSLPLSLHGRSFGVMSISYEQPRAFTELEIDALQLYVNHAAVAYDSARRMETLRHMREAAEALAGAADAKGVLKEIVQRARAALEADSAAIWVYDAARNSFVPDGWVASHISGELKREFWKPRPRADGTAYTVMARGWVAVDDVRDEGSYPFLGGTTRSLLDRIGVQSFIGVSLTVGDEPLGVLYVNFGRPRHFGEEDQQTARTFANHAALALKKARLLEQVTKAKKAAEAVARVTVLGNRVETLQSIAEETQRALDCDIVMLFEYDGESGTLVHPPTMVGLDEEGRRKAMRGGVVEPNSVVYLILEKDYPYIAENVERDPLFMHRRFSKEERIKSCVGIPIQMQEKKLGVMFVNYRAQRRFSPDELSNMLLFANQAAVAIRNAQLFEARALRLRQHAELLKFSEGLLGVVSLQETMDRAVKIAADILAVDCCAIVLPDEGGELVVSAAYGWPPEYLGRERLKDGQASQSGLTIKSRAPVVVEDYEREHRFYVPEFIFEHGVRSGLSAPMCVGGGEPDEFLIGVMLVHSKSPRSFSEEDQTLLSLIANDTAIAIQRTRQYEELKRIKGLVGSRSALAWMGMASSVWRHAVEGMAINVRNAAALLRRDLERGLTTDTLARATERISMIERNAEQILQKQITAALSEEGGDSVKVNELIRGRTSRLWKVDPYKSVELVLDLALEEDATVRASVDWLRRALDVLIDNAVKAMPGAAIRRLTVTTARTARKVEILVSDTGRGIPEDVSAQLFNSPVRKAPSAKGLGIGLLMAEAIVETYGGTLRVKHTSPDGTAMVIELPLEE